MITAGPCQEPRVINNFIFLKGGIKQGDKKIVISRGLSDKQRAVVATIRMRLTIDQSLACMEGEGYRMSQSTYSRAKRYMKQIKLSRLHQIAAIGFEDQHLDRIDNCEHIEQLMWKDYFLEKSAYRRVMILKEI